MNFKKNVQVQRDVLSLTGEYLTPLLLLKTMFQEKKSPLVGVPSHININLETFGRNNLWYGTFPKSFSNWTFNKNREEV